ncbi:MAG: SpoIIE family protein phosphatase [Acidobacteria bacterium]|nr:SpoIIE family protein phosphatase [Acidobacteriota bacterium]MBI3424451.1 SpoIIE family protein phosphatase [Acidobacteriota bacterium]
MTRPKLQFIVVLAFFGLMLTYSVVGLYLDIVRPGSDDGWRGSGTNGVYHITGTDADSPAYGLLRQGDRILAFNGVSVATDPSGLSIASRLPPGTRYTMTVLRDGQELTVTLHTIPRRPASFPWSRLIPPLFWLTGLFVFLLKPEDRQARLLALMLGSFSGLLSGNLSVDSIPGLLGLMVGLARIAGLCSVPLLLHLFLVFPAVNPWLERWPKLMRWLYLPFCLIVLPTFGVGRLPVKWNHFFFSSGVVQRAMEYKLPQIAITLLNIYLLAALVCLILSYRTADMAARRRLRVVLAGSLLGFGSLLLIVLMEATNTQEKLKTVWEWLQNSTLLTLPLVPLSFAYAIVRHRVIPISLLLRRGARYLLVSRGSVLLVMGGLCILLFFLLENLFRFWRPANGRAIGVVSAFVAIFFWRITQRLHERFIAPAIDRRFFRQAYDSQQILTELAESLRTTTDIASLLESVADRLQSALQTANVTIFLRDAASGEYRNAYICEYSPATGRAVHCAVGSKLPFTAARPAELTTTRADKESDPSRLPHYAATLAQLNETGQPLELDGGETAFDLNNTSETSVLTAAERATLLETQAALLLPLKTKDDMPGVIALGARLGDLPFSGEDKRLLQSVAASASLALENAQLVERMLADARRHQELEAENEQRAKELEEARQLQLSMLPRSIPQLPNLEIAAFMQTATEVGGDYYDFHLSSDGTLTIAIGDATGHGLKAGTMVTATKSLFNHLAAHTDVVTTMHDASRALKQMNLRSLFMALTLVKVRGERLHCSVAGMPPILIYRAGTQDIEELALRGAPLGGMTHYNYREAEIALAPNDVLLLMSDGLTERFNPDDEMFDYERTKAAFIQLAHATPHAIADGLLKASEVWAQGRPLDDDLTLVVLKRKADQ